MMPTAHEIAVALVAASKIIGVDPIDVATGADQRAGCPTADKHAISRARAYAARAVDKVFNRPEVAIARPGVARLVGVNKPSWAAFFSSLDSRPLSWWSDEAFKVVVDAVMDCDPPQEQQQKITCDPAPLKMGDLPAPKWRPSLPAAPKPSERGTLEPGGYRPAPGTYERELTSASPHGRLRTRLDKFAEGLGKPRTTDAGGDEQIERREAERRQCRDLLAEAAANTAKLQAALPPESNED